MTSPRRRWFRYSLRTLFVFLTLSSVAFVWIAKQMTWIRERHEALRLHAWFCKEATWTECVSTEPHAPWQVRIFGERGVSEVTVILDSWEETDSEFNAKIERTKKLFPEATINPDKCQSCNGQGSSLIWGTPPLIICGHVSNYDDPPEPH